MPGEGNVDSGVVTKWLVGEGDEVFEGDYLCEIESSKTSFGIESPVSGVVKQILCQEGDETPAMQTIAVIEQQ